MDTILNFCTKELSGLVFMLIAFGYMWVAKKLGDLVADYNANHEIEEKSNLAVGLKRAGFYLAIPLAMYGAIIGTSKGLVEDARSLLGCGLFIVILLFIAQVVNNYIILRGIKTKTELAKGNISVGLVEGFGYIATGLIAQASFTGEGAIISALVFFALGQIVLIGAVRLYEKLTPWNDMKEISEGNPAAGLMIGGIMVAISIAIYGSICGNFTNWLSDICSFGIYSVVAVVLLALVDKLIAPFFLPGTNLLTEIERDKNVAAVAVVVAVKIAVALMINAAIV